MNNAGAPTVIVVPSSEPLDVAAWCQACARAIVEVERVPLRPPVPDSTEAA